MGTLTSGGSLVTGTNVVDQSLSTADISAASLSELFGTVLTSVPKPNWPIGTGTNGVTGRNLNSNTTLSIAQFILSNKITVNKVSFNASGASVAGTVKVAIFSEDGQTRHINLETASISGAALITTTLGAGVDLAPGAYWIAILPVGTANIDVSMYGNPGGGFGNLNELVTSEPILNGTLTVSASTMPSTISPTGITGTTTSSHALAIRLDN